MSEKDHHAGRKHEQYPDEQYGATVQRHDDDDQPGDRDTKELEGVLDGVRVVEDG